MATNTVYVITGASRGIGFGLLVTYLARPSTTVVAIVRSTSTATNLQGVTDKIVKGQGSILYLVQLDMSALGTTDSIRERFLSDTNHEIGHINTIICSAGLCPEMSATIGIQASQLRECFEVNTIAPLFIFQSLWTLMKNSTSPKFVVLSSSMGSIGAMEPFAAGAYGPSKAALNWIVKSLHVQMEQSGLIAIALHPGWVQTDMGQYAAKQWNYADGPPSTVDESVCGIVKVVDEATRESTSGRFVEYTGEEIPW
jgi:NAD(P)-dependent dehydrogenase (short-subunit alcohol dehydrogenase family)